MRMISPEVDAPQVTIAEDQLEYAPVTAALITHPGFPASTGGWNSVLLAFRPSDDERLRIGAGEDVYISLLTFGGPMQPVCILTGKHDAAAVFGRQPT